MVAGAQCHGQSSPPGPLPFQPLPICRSVITGSACLWGFMVEVESCGGKLGRWFGHGGLGVGLELYNSSRFVGEMDGGWRRLAGEE